MKARKNKAVPITLQQLYDDLYRPIRAPDCTASAVQQYHVTISRFRFFLEREPTITDLQSGATVAAWLQYLVHAEKLSIHTVNSRLRMLKSLARFARQHKVASGGGVFDLDDMGYLDARGTRRPAASPAAPRKTEPTFSARPLANPAGAATTDSDPCLEPKRVPGLGSTSPLEDLIESYLLDRQIGRATVYLYRRSVGTFNRWLNVRATVSDLTDQRINAFLLWCNSQAKCRRMARNRENGYSTWTKRGLRQQLLALRRHAADLGLCPQPGRIRRVPIRLGPPRAWTQSELQRLLATVAHIPGTMCTGAKRAQYLEALIRAAWDLGCRRGDLWALRRTDLERAGGSVGILQQKTGRCTHRALSPEALRLILALPGDRPLAWPYAVRHFYNLWAKVCRQSGIEPGAMQRIRRSAASYVERDQPGSAWRFLGHASPGLDRAHYIDPTIAYPSPVRPPQLEAVAVEGGAAC